MIKTVGLFPRKAHRLPQFVWEVRSSKKIVLVLLIAAAVLLPSIAILHAASTTAHTDATEAQDHNSDHNDGAHHDGEHDDNETSDDNSVVHMDDDANENATETD